MHKVIVCINDVVPDMIGFSTAKGMPGDIRFDFKDISGMPYPNVDTLNPQLVFRPFTTYGAYGYDIVIDDVGGASGLATIPGSVMNDRYNMEVYTRNDVGQPQMMIAHGRVRINGYAYQTSSPLSPATATVGPSGPAGPQGPTGTPGMQGVPGQRGSRWYTGAGMPTGFIPDDRMEGDMYLDENNGDVWRWSGGSWTRFTGA